MAKKSSQPTVANERGSALDDGLPSRVGESAPTQPEAKEQVWRARRFAMFAVLFHLPLILWVLQWRMEMTAGRSQIVDEAVAGMDVHLSGGGLIGYLWLLIVYLTAKTAEASGVGFVLSFALAIFPPTFPAAWARIGRVSMIRAYVYLILTGALTWFLWKEFAYTNPLLLYWLVLLLLPFLIYQAFGCAVGQVADNLDFTPVMVGFLVCCMPSLLFVVLALEGLPDSFIDLPRHMVDLVNARQWIPFHPEWWGNVFFFPTMSLIWISVCWVLWLNNIHKNLKIPHFTVSHDDLVRYESDDDGRGSGGVPYLGDGEK